MKKSQDKNDAQRQSNLRDSKVNPEKQPISILFLGIDDNEGREKNGQSIEHSIRCNDFITLIRKSIKLECLVSHEIQLVIYLKLVITIKLHMRMLMVAQLLMDSVEATMNVPVDYYVRVNMKAFVEAVDELGGIYYDVPYNLNEPNSDTLEELKLKRLSKLNGDQALAVARTRHQDSDLNVDKDKWT